ncbi:hypothetical protein [Variovorax sp. E3]|nr:hypothetical protein [Variovorax sp. E3]
MMAEKEAAPPPLIAVKVDSGIVPSNVADPLMLPPAVVQPLATR